VNDETAAQVGRPRRDRLPRNRQRERILQIVRERDAAADAVEIASQTGLHVSTVRFHLDALCDDELIVRTRVNLPGAGRPRTGYLAVEERLDYRVLAEVLAMEMGRTADIRARRAQRAGQRWAARIAASKDGGAEPAAPPPEDADALDHAALRITDVFTRMGFAAELAAETASETPARERVIRLHACPVRDLARSHPEVGCQVHRGLLQGLLADESPMSEHLEPFVEPELCVVRLCRP
jgi:predicted ArsR family transcriptional regulator